MNDAETAVRFTDLRYIEDSLAEACEAAAGPVGGDTGERLMRFAAGHRENSELLSRALTGLGVEELPVADEVAALGRELVKASRNASGEDEALEALLLAEMTAAAQIEETLEEHMREESVRVLRAVLDEERQHVGFIESRMPVGATVSGRVAFSGGGISTDQTFVDDRNPDDFER